MSSYNYIDVLYIIIVYELLGFAYDYLKGKVVSYLNKRKGVVDETSD